MLDAGLGGGESSIMLSSSIPKRAALEVGIRPLRRGS